MEPPCGARLRQGSLPPLHSSQQTPRCMPNSSPLPTGDQRPGAARPGAASVIQCPTACWLRSPRTSQVIQRRRRPPHPGCPPRKRAPGGPTTGRNSLEVSRAPRRARARARARKNPGNLTASGRQRQIQSLSTAERQSGGPDEVAWSPLSRGASWSLPFARAQVSSTIQRPAPGMPSSSHRAAPGHAGRQHWAPVRGLAGPVISTRTPRARRRRPASPH